MDHLAASIRNASKTSFGAILDFGFWILDCPLMVKPTFVPSNLIGRGKIHSACHSEEAKTTKSLARPDRIQGGILRFAQNDMGQEFFSNLPNPKYPKSKS